MPIKAETLHDEAALLKELFAKHSKLSQKDFAKTFDIGTPALLWQYLNGRKALGLKAAIKIATGLGVDVGAFSPRLARELRDLAIPNVTAASGMQKRIPILSDVQAGSPNGGDVEAREAAIDQGNYVIRDADLSDECFALTIQGRSMEPDFVQGDIIIVDPSISPSPGDFVVASRVDPLCGGLEVTFKKYRPRSYNSRGQMVFELSPLNPDYPTYVSDADKLTVIAVLVEHRRKFKHN